MAKPIKVTTVITGKAAESFENYIALAQPSKAKQEMVVKAKQARDAMKPRR